MSTNRYTKFDSNGRNFAKTHKDTYPLIDPTKQDASGKNVLITGASKGIGRAIAISYAKAGAAGIAIAARSDLSSLVEEIGKAASSAGRSKPKVVPLSMDVTSRDSVEAAAREVGSKLKYMDILVINAGLLEKLVPVIDQDPDAWWAVWQTNILGPFLTMKYFMPMLLASPNKDRTVVGLSSIGAHIMMPGLSAYQPSKLALLRIMEFVNLEYGDEGILAYCVHPGGVPTEMAKSMGEQYHALITDTPELAADTISWLTSERREWLAGRYLSCQWNMGQVLEKKQQIIDDDLLKVRMAVDDGLARPSKV